MDCWEGSPPTNGPAAGAWSAQPFVRRVSFRDTSSDRRTARRGTVTLCSRVHLRVAPRTAAGCSVVPFGVPLPDRHASIGASWSVVSSSPGSTAAAVDRQNMARWARIRYGVAEAAWADLVARPDSALPCPRSPGHPRQPASALRGVVHSGGVPRVRLRRGGITPSGRVPCLWWRLFLAVGGDRTPRSGRSVRAGSSRHAHHRR